LTVGDPGKLRPLERPMARLADEGVVPDEIGRRFNRSGDFVLRVLALAGLPDRNAPPEQHGLRPLERRLLRWREAGAASSELADRFRRGPDHIDRVLELADYKRSMPGWSAT
jgi:DNA-binding CsgD family transcriptional regulator